MSVCVCQLLGPIRRCQECSPVSRGMWSSVICSQIPKLCPHELQRRQSLTDDPHKNEVLECAHGRKSFNGVKRVFVVVVL